MRQFIMGCIRQLTTRDEPFVVQGTATGSHSSEQQKQLNIRIQRAAADIVTRLITADVIQSQRAEQVEEIVGDMLRRAFEGAMLATKGWRVLRSPSHAFHKELRLRSVGCAECQTDTSVDWLA